MEYVLKNSNIVILAKNYNPSIVSKEWLKEKKVIEENAVKFTGPGGKIRIRGGENPGAFSIEDTGIGMPESEIPKIFSKFYRIDRSVARGGTGLGLSIVKQFVEMHGGQIEFESEEGKGSIFKFELPIKQ